MSPSKSFLFRSVNEGKTTSLYRQKTLSKIKKINFSGRFELTSERLIFIYFIVEILHFIG